MIDPYASVVVSSSTSKRVTLYEAATSKPLCRASSGQITTAMCFSNNMKHLVTTTDNGLIFVWRLPEKIAQCLQKIKNEGQRLEAAIERTPSVIEEVEENDELAESLGAKPISSFSGLNEHKSASSAPNTTQNSPDVLVEGNDNVKDNKPASLLADEDFDFEVPAKLKPMERDSTMIKKRKEEVVDVLANIKNAVNFVD